MALYEDDEVHHNQFQSQKIEPEIAEELGIASKLLAPILRGSKVMKDKDVRERRSVHPDGSYKAYHVQKRWFAEKAATG